MRLDRLSRLRGTVVSRVASLVLAAASCAAQPTPSATATGAIRGVVSDPSGSVVASAIVILQPSGSTQQRTTITEPNGSFDFSAVAPGTYDLTVKALGFADREMKVTVSSGESRTVPPVVLQVAPSVSTVNVGLPPHELATVQEHQEEKQRVLGIFPNFYVSYDPNAAPLTAAQKFQLGWRTTIDPEVLISAPLIAGIEQARNSYPEFGQGMEGFGKRLGAAYADRATGVFIGHVVTQSVFRQDPRYFYKGTGSFRSRLLYAIGTAFIVKGDNRHWQPDYSDVVGGLASGEISTLYYPASSRVGLRLFHGVLLGFAGRAGDHVFQEFIYNKLTTHVPKIAARLRPVVPEGTPVSLISTEDVRSTAGARPVTFVLARDLTVNGAVVAKAGSKASGEIGYTTTANGTTHIALENVTLKIGDAVVPLRSAPEKGGAGALNYHWVENTGRIAIELYSARNIELKPTQ